MKNRLSITLFLICLHLPVTATASTITNEEIDSFLEAAPKTAYVLNKIKRKVKQNYTLSKALSRAQMDGSYMRRMIKASKQWPEYTKLEQIVKDSGFKSIDDWSLVADRVLGVVSSANWVVLTASMPKSKSKKPELTMDTNLFAYIKDENNDSDLREKFGKQLEQTCRKMCYDQSDLAVVGARYSEIKAVISKSR